MRSKPLFQKYLSAENFGASKSNLMEEPSLLINQRSMEMKASA